MKKICYVVTIPLTIRAFFIPQLQYLAAHGFDVTVVCGDDGKIKDELGNQIHFHGCPIPRGMSFFGSLKAIFHLIGFFRKEKFDLIQYSTPNAALYAAIAAKLTGCKIRNYHLMGYRYLGTQGVARSVFKTIERFTCSLSTSIECVSKSNLEFGAEERLFKKEKATVVWNGSSGGVDLKRFDYTKRERWRAERREELGYQPDDFIFGFVGRITRDKGINELLEAFFQLNNNSKLFIIGDYEDDGTVDPVLWEKAKNSPNVMIHEPSNQIEEFCAMIDVLVLPSYREGFGNVIIEAAAMGTPAIVSDIMGPIDAIIIDKTSLIIRPKAVFDLVSAMKTIRLRDISQMGLEAATYTSNSFESCTLCEKILERKIQLMENR